MILISAGHHQKAQGAQFQGRTEWKEAIKWRDLLLDILGKEKATAIPSGLLRDKVAFVNSRHCTLAMEIHFNSAIAKNGTPVGAGSETLVYPGSTKGLIAGEILQRRIAQVFPPDRGVKEGWHRMDAPGQVDYHGDRDGDETINYFLRKTKCTAVIVEPEFIHHRITLQMRRQECCMAIALGLMEVIEKFNILDGNE